MAEANDQSEANNTLDEQAGASSPGVSKGLAMTARNARRLMAALWALTILLVVVDFGLIVAGREAPYRGWGFRGYPALVGALFGTVGLVIVRRLPFHMVGWLAGLAALLSAIQTGLFEYMVYAIELYPESLPGGPFVAWFLNWFWMPVVLTVFLVVLFFPDGRLPTRRWRALVGLQVLLALVAITASSLTPGPLNSSLPTLMNPYSQPWAAAILGPLLIPSYLLLLLLMVGSATAALVVRWRRGQAVERQQLKWLLYAMGLAFLTSPLAAFGNQIVQVIFQLALAFVPVTIGVAIVRYRLYDIDLIIRRTAVYLIITALLAGTYFGVVVAAQQLLRVLTGQESPLAVVISTLAIAALFAPLRRWVQDFVDRRFYRRKYDASRALSRFAATARDEMDLERLAAALLQTVNETMQLERSSVWLKDGEERRQAG